MPTLHELWLQTLNRHADAVAVRDAATGEQWTFSALQEEATALPPVAPRQVHVASVRGVGGARQFVLECLRTWRDDAVLCPVEVETPPLLADAVARGTRFAPEICHLKFTSGSTGQPRGVLFRGEQLVADAENIRLTMGLDQACPNLAVISLAHSYGFSNLILPLLLQGHPMVLVPDPMPSSKRQAHALGIRYTVPAVPAMWRAWHQAGLLKDAPIALAISAGAPLPLQLEEEIYAVAGIKIHNFYGSSECGGIAYDASPEPRADASYAGQAMHGVSLSLGADGCLGVHSQAVGEGYWPAETEERATLGGGTFRTSDVVDLNVETGGVTMRGRLSDTINVAGRKLNPAEVEAALLSCDGVRHCVVFGVPSADEVRCEETVACVNVDAAAGVRQEDLVRWMGERLPGWQRPRRYWLRQDLVPNARGKFSRAEWRGRFLETELTGFLKD
jgi:long-chain acyl-CoA synthetase